MFNDLVFDLKGRSALAFALRKRVHLSLNDVGVGVLTTYSIDDFKRNGLSLPDPLEQADNLLKYIGDFERNSGDTIEQMRPEIYSEVGAINPAAMFRILKELKARRLIDCMDVSAKDSYGMGKIGLTLDGWRLWKDIKKGDTNAGYGFLAMQFGEEALDALVSNHIKPGLKEALGIELRRVDAPEVARAGVIDNIMRDEIRRAAFVIAELTHGNKGAYWEAGFAEGLGKPVIYLCEKDTFEEKETHFDVRHCTTVLWEADNPNKLVKDLAATVRNSISLLK